MSLLNTMTLRWTTGLGAAILLTPTEVQLIGGALSKTTKQVRAVRRVHCGDARYEVPSATWDNPRARDEWLARHAMKWRQAASERPSMGVR